MGMNLCTTALHEVLNPLCCWLVHYSTCNTVGIVLLFHMVVLVKCLQLCYGIVDK